MAGRYFVLVVIALLFSATLEAVNSVRVMALFPQKAMLSINGKSRVLAEGQTSKEGVKLISATPYEAVLEWDGQQQVLQLGSGVNASYETVKQVTVRISRDKQGSYSTLGTVNGRHVEFVVDTGANLVAMSEHKADQLGIKFRHKPATVNIHSASGTTKGHLVKLDSIKIGGIEERNIDCVIIKGNHLPVVLLGMSFLDRVDIENVNNIMLLKKR